MLQVQEICSHDIQALDFVQVVSTTLDKKAIDIILFVQNWAIGTTFW